VFPPDLALAMLIDRTTQVYQQHQPVYIVYTEMTHVSAPSLGRSQEMDRHVIARNADDEAVMQDVPNGGPYVGTAFPIIPFFDPFSQFSFSYFANLKAVDITLRRGEPLTFPIPPPDPGSQILVPYISFWNVSYAPDSRADRLHFLISPTSRFGTGMYPSDVVEDGATHLPSHITLSDTASDMTISLDYGNLDGYWIVTHGTFTSTEHALFMTFVVTADVTYSDFSFPATAPAEAAMLPSPSPTASP
jgi:hypothetical protein